ncbi:MAG: hypothetical protein ACOVO9_01870 [Bacteroidia bacterium]
MKKFIPKHSILLLISSLLISIVSCKQDAKIVPAELQEGLYDLEVIESSNFPADSTKYLKDALFSSQIYSKPLFLIQKGLKKRMYTICVATDIWSKMCDVFNCQIDLAYVSSDSIYFQKPPCYIYGFREDFQPKDPFGPNFFVDSTLMYQVQINNLKLLNTKDLVGNWREIIQCKYTRKDSEGKIIIDSIVNRPVFAKIKLKFVKGLQ